MAWYFAQLIDGGRVVGEDLFEATSERNAMLEANDGVDVMSGRWVDLVIVDKWDPPIDKIARFLKRRGARE